MLEIARDIESECPAAWLLNYTNPMSILTGGLLRGTRVRTVGLCHSVQVCAPGLLRRVGMHDAVKDLRWKVAGINHMGWLLEIRDGRRDLYPEIKRRAARLNRKARRPGAKKHDDMVRFEIMRHFGYYVTESSEHAAEYSPYWIKAAYPELVETFNIPLDEYPRRCVAQIENWKQQARKLVANTGISHTRTHEYASYILEAMETGTPFVFGGNVINHGMIPNLPQDACVEIPCVTDRNGVRGCYAGPLPEQCAALNRQHLAVHALVIEAALTRRREAIYQAAYLDPHTGSELPLDRIRALCDELIEAHAGWLPEYV
jgi:alpha-galactosidase